MKDGTIHRRVLDYAYTDIATLYRDFHISEQGYTEKQVEKSRARYGKNILSGRASDTVLYRLRRAFVNPFAVILFVLAIISFVTDVILASNFSRNVTPRQLFCPCCSLAVLFVLCRNCGQNLLPTV